MMFVFRSFVKYLGIFIACCLAIVLAIGALFGSFAGMAYLLGLTGLPTWAAATISTLLIMGVILAAVFSANDWANEQDKIKAEKDREDLNRYYKRNYEKQEALIRQANKSE